MNTDPGGSPDRKAKRVWPLLATSILLLLIVFSFDTGVFMFDRTQDLSLRLSIGTAFSVGWIITMLRRRKDALWKPVLCIGLPLLLVCVYAGFSLGKEYVYPNRAQRMVQEFQQHSRELLAIKKEFFTERDALRPEQLSLLEPKVAIWNAHTEVISDLVSQLPHETLPPFVSGVISIAKEVVEIDKRHVANLYAQISLIKSKATSDARESAVLGTRLRVLREEEENIERERESINYDQRVKEVGKKAGY